jgi:CheY-like chemotaxis protein
MVSLPKPVRPCHLWRALDQAMGGPQDHVEAPGPRSPGSGGSRLLVVDDNLINRRAACRLLERLGAIVDEAADGQTAVAMVARTQYDLVFMDCQMPAMDGYEATARIRALKGPAARTPIVALTAYAMAGDRERCVLAGMSDYVAKPVTRAVLAEVLQRWHLLAPPAAVPEMEQPST